MILVGELFTKNRLRSVLIEQLCRSHRAIFFPFFFRFFFSKGRKKQEKQETFPKLANLTEGVMFGRLHIPVFGKKK